MNIDKIKSRLMGNDHVTEVRETHGLLAAFTNIECAGKVLVVPFSLKGATADSTIEAVVSTVESCIADAARDAR